MKAVNLLLGLALVFCMSIKAETLWHVGFESPTYQQGLLVGQEDWTVATGDNLQTVTTEYNTVTAPEGSQFVYADALAATFSPVFSNIFDTVDITAKYVRLSYYMLCEGDFNNNFGFYDEAGSFIFLVNADANTDTNTNMNLISMPWNGGAKVGDFVEGEWTKISVDIDTLNLPWVAVGATVNDTNRVSFSAPFSAATLPAKLRLRPYGGVPSVSYTCYDDITIETVPSFRVEASPSSLTFFDGDDTTKPLELTTQFEGMSYEATVSTDSSWITLSEDQVTITSLPTTVNVTVDSSGLTLPTNGTIYVTGETGMMEVGVTLTIPSEPYDGEPIDIPGVIEAEYFDLGGQYVAYYDTDVENWGGGFRLEEYVDVSVCADGGYNVGWTQPTEWMGYTVDAEAGTYDVLSRIGSAVADRQFKLTLDGEDLCTIDVPNLGDWNAYTTVTNTNVNINESGEANLRIELITDGVNINWIEFVKKDTEAPTPNPMTWEVMPFWHDDTTITMVCSTATHPTDSVEYYFEEVSGNSGGDDSGWQTGTSYTDAGLDRANFYSYRVKARKASGSKNETEWSGTGSVSAPYGGVPRTIPGQIEFEDYDIGGEGVAYHDIDAQNWGGAYRLEEGVDVEIFGNNEYCIGYTAVGEWLNFSVNVEKDGHYLVTTKVGSAAETPGEISFWLDDVELCSFDVPNTGWWKDFQEVFTNDIYIAGGNGRTLHVKMDGGYNADWVNFAFVDADAPTPNPMEWTGKPVRAEAGTVRMECVEATHAEGVEYYFEETTGNPGGTNSGWQSEKVFTATGLEEGYTYVYRVKARNLSANLNETLWSDPVEAIGSTIGINLASDDAPMGNLAFDGVAMWTDAVGANGADLALNASAGSVTCSWASQEIWAGGGVTNAEDTLYFGYLDDQASNSVTITGLQSWMDANTVGAYNVRVYRNADEGGYFTDVDILSEDTVIDVISFPSNIVVRFEDYSVRAVNDSTAISADTITISPQTGSYPMTRATMSGVRITAIPEPAFFGITGIIGLLFLRKRS
jgi:hypothetical protein